MVFSPNRPLGRKTRITIRRANVNASENSVRPSILIRFSQMPIRNAPIIAPGIEPMPPNTAATNAFRPGIAPIVGVTVV